MMVLFLLFYLVEYDFPLRYYYIFPLFFGVNLKWSKESEIFQSNCLLMQLFQIINYSKYSEGIDFTQIIATVLEVLCSCFFFFFLLEFSDVNIKAPLPKMLAKKK